MAEPQITITFSRQEAEAVEAALDFIIGSGAPVPENDPLWRAAIDKLRAHLWCPGCGGAQQEPALIQNDPLTRLICQHPFHRTELSNKSVPMAAVQWNGPQNAQPTPPVLDNEHFRLLANWSRAIALMPIDVWLGALLRAEEICPFVDPTLYRQYIYSRKPEAIKKLLRAALELKRTVEELQQDGELIAEEAEARRG